jgi:hypothetical protein
MEFLLGIIVFILDIWAIFNILQSKESGVTKLIWCLAILLLPVIGLIVWFFAGPRKVTL